MSQKVKIIKAESLRQWERDHVRDAEQKRARLEACAKGHENGLLETLIQLNYDRAVTIIQRIRESNRRETV